MLLTRFVLLPEVDESPLLLMLSLSQNEADIYEPNYEVSFWGTNYERLLSIKNEVDPDHLLDCWQCGECTLNAGGTAQYTDHALLVGWEPSAPRFSCYLPE